MTNKALIINNTTSCGCSLIDPNKTRSDIFIILQSLNLIHGRGGKLLK